MFQQNLSTGTPIAPPSDFPVHWPDAESAAGYWTRDREHMPQPITPMYNSVSALVAPAGHRRAASAYQEPIVAIRGQIFNTYLYMRLLPFQGTPEEIEARAQRNRSLLLNATLNLRSLWEQNWRPRLQEIWAFWESFTPANAAFPALVEHLERTLDRTTDLYEVHYLMGAPMWFAIDEFVDFYTDLFPGSAALDAHRLLQGFDNQTLRLNRSLWQLSRLAACHPALVEAIETRPPASLYAWLQAAVRQDETLQDFVQALETFLDNYGRRSSLWDWGYPSWQDDPSPVFSNLKNYLRQPQRDLLAELAQTAAERESAVAQARQGLQNYPLAVRRRFEGLLEAAQLALVMTEDHTYYIDFNGLGWVHRLIGEFGKRFQSQGRLHHPTDIFYLSIDELRRMIQDETLDLSSLADTRRSEIETWSSYKEPGELGRRPARSFYAYSPQARRMLRYCGANVDESRPPLPQNGLLYGQPGSAGKVRGRARLIRSLAEAGRLQPGDILVTTTTAPPWTPLFLSAAGLVTDAGGLLSHGAVVAREMRIPAVVGTHYATQNIQDGQWIELDGNLGQVRILTEEV